MGCNCNQAGPPADMPYDPSVEYVVTGHDNPDPELPNGEYRSMSLAAARTFQDVYGGRIRSRAIVDRPA